MRLHELIHPKGQRTDLVWKSGVLLDKDNCRIKIMQQVNPDAGLNVIDILIASSNLNARNDFMMEIQREIDHFHRKGFENMRCSEMVACRCSSC